MQQYETSKHRNPLLLLSPYLQLDLGRRRTLACMAPDNVDALKLDNAGERHEEQELGIVVVAV